MVDIPARLPDKPIQINDGSDKKQPLPRPEYSTWDLQPQDYRSATAAQQNSEKQDDRATFQFPSLTVFEDGAKSVARTVFDSILHPDRTELLIGLAGAAYLLSRQRQATRDTAVRANDYEMQLSDVQRQGLRHQAEIDYERLTFPRQPTPRIEDSAKQLSRPTFDMQPLEYPASGRSAPYADWNDFAARGLRSIDTLVRKYSVDGYPGLSITLDEGYAKQLDEVRQLRMVSESVPMNPEETQKQSEAREKLAQHPLRNAILPEDVVAHLHELPNPSLVREIILRSDPNPQDAWHDQTYEKGFTSAATATDTGVITFYPSQQPSNMGRTFRHEWAHLLENNCVGRSEFNDAAKIEKDGFFMGSYPKRNDRENWAVHFEEITDHDADRFLHFCNEAPVRAYTMCEGLKETLKIAPEQGPFHDQLMARIEYCEKFVKPKAIDVMADVLNKYDAQNADSIEKAKAAASLLFEMKEPRAVDALTHFAAAHPESPAARLAYVAAVETLKLHDPSKLPKMLEQFLDAKYPWKDEVITDLQIASVKNPEANRILKEHERSGDVPPEAHHIANTEVIGKPGPGITVDTVDRLRKLADESGVPIVVYGSRQTGWSEPKQRPFTPDSDVDIGVIGVENFDRLTDHPSFSNGYKKNDIPGIHHYPARLFDTEQEAIDHGYLIIKPKFNTTKFMAQLDHEVLKGTPGNRAQVLEFMRGQLGEGSKLPPHQQEELSRVMERYRAGDMETMRAVHSGLDLPPPLPVRPVAPSGGADRTPARVDAADHSRTTAQRQADARWGAELHEVRESGAIRTALERANFPADRARELERRLLSEEARDRDSARRELDTHFAHSARDLEAFRKSLRDREGSTEGGGKLGSLAIVVGALMPYVFPEDEK